ncbi:hypothetical protein [Hymenobacter radiodurans]|uniref:hypothetical protein n=1 Tax=Hymenobacter radiodurans TaxID=2496028 RepID=UPI001058E352|nr:hypothetical protein [Hymenobacter radiodurans]
MTLTKSISLVALVTGLLLLIPLTAKLTMANMLWTAEDFVAAGIMLFGAGLTFVLIARLGNNNTYRLAAAAAVGAGLLLVWAQLAVGLVGSEDNPVNLLFGAVLAVAFIGSIAARFQPRGMANAMFAASLTYVVVTLLALFVWPPSPDTAEPQVRLANVLAANGIFAAIWAFSGWMFLRASASSSNQNRQLA